MTIFKTMKNIVFFLIAFFGLLAEFSLFISCDAGLGESVDTSAPNVSITTPAASASISGNVLISGSCSDDKGVARVVITVNNTVTKESNQYEIKPDANNWTADIDKAVFKDGTYSVDAVAYDNAGRVSDTANRVFDVDNTPPVFCVTRPNSLNIKDPAAFGRTVIIKGEIADDHAISSMNIRVFKYSDETGTVNEITENLCKTSFSGFETAGGTEVEIAHYYSDEEEAKAAESVNPGQYSLYQNYKELYSGASDGDTVYYYILPTLTDIAGNTSSCCYIGTQLKQLFSKACSVDTTADSWQTAHFKKILNGSYYLNENDTDIAKQILAGTYDQSGIGTEYKYYSDASSMLAISINANNSPGYEFGGYAIDKDSIVFKKVASEGKLTVKVSAGLDLTPIVVNSIKVNMWECDDTLEKKDKSKATYSSEKDGGIILKDSNGNVLSDCDATVQTTNATYSVTLPNGLSAGTHYILTAEGEDVSGNKFYSVNTYALMVAMSDNVPKIEFKDPFFIKASAISENTGSSGYTAKITVIDKSGADGKGTIKENGNYIRVTPCIYNTYIKNKGYLIDNSQNIVKTCDAKEYSGEEIKGADGSYYIEVPLNVFPIDSSVENYTVSLKVGAKNTGATSETNTFIFWADNKAPKLSITSPENNAKIFETDANITSAEGKYSYSLRGRWSDVDGSGTSKLYYTERSVSEKPGVEYKPFTYTADSTKTYYLKQSEDCYLAQSGLTGKIDVSDGYYYISLKSDDDWKEVSEAAATTKESKWNHSISVENESDKTISFVAIDAVGNMSEVEKRTGLVYDFSVPSLSLSSTVEAHYNVECKFEVTAEDKLGFVSADKLEVAATRNGTAVNDGDDGYTLERKISDDEKNISATITIKPGSAGKGNGKWSFNIKATDIAGRESSTRDITTTIDNVTPNRKPYDSSGKYLLCAAGEKSGTEADWYSADTLTISGRFDESTSGIDTVTYVLTPAGAASESEGIKETVSVGGKCNEKSDGGTENYVLYKISPTGFKEGVNVLTIYATDLAGNKGGGETYRVQVDKTAPDVTASCYSFSQDASNPVLVDISNIVMSNKKNPITLYGRVTDTISGIKNISFTIAGEIITPSSIKYTTAEGLDSAEKYSGAAWEDLNSNKSKEYKGYKAVIPAEELKTGGDVWIKATDSADNVSEQKIFAITVDETPPVIKLKSPVANSEINGNTDVSGTASDNTALASIALYLSNNNEKEIIKDSDVEIGSPITDSTMYNWSRSFTASKVENAKIIILPDYPNYKKDYKGSPEQIYIKVLAYDKAGNTTTEVYPYNVNPDNDRPTITLTTVNLAGMKNDNYALFTGSKVLDGSISDDDGIESVQYSIDDGETWSDESVSNGTFAITIPDDGKYTMKFKVADRAGTTFESSSDKSYLSPKLEGKDKEKFSDGDTCLYIKVDTTSPETRNPVYATAPGKGDSYSEASSTLGEVGGNKKYVKIAFDAYDKNEVKSAELKLNGETYTGTKFETGKEKKEPDGKTWYKWIITDIDVSKLESGMYSALLTITDTSGLKNTETLKFNVDNTPPVVTKLAPSSTNAVYGNISMYGSVDYAKEISYALSLEKTSEPAEGEFKKISDAGLTWFIYFDGDKDAMGTHDKTLNQFIIDKGVTTADAIKNQNYTEITPVYVWIKAVDDLGNTCAEFHEISLDPQGGRPTFTYSYPETDDMRVGGTVKLYGGADDDEAVKSVFLQIISKAHNYGSTSGTFGEPSYIEGSGVENFGPTAADWNYLQSVKDESGNAVYKIYHMATYNAETKTGVEWPAKPADAALSAEPKDYGILADFKGSAWNLKINTRSEFNPTSGTNDLYVCGYAYDGTKFSLPQYRYMKVDADSPVIKNKYLFLTGDDSTSREYSDGIYVKDAWTLEFDLTDGDAIAKVYAGISDNSIADAKTSAEAEKSGDTTTDAEWFSGKISKSSITNGYKISCALDTGNGVGSKYIYILFADKKGNFGECSFTVNYDNTKPVISSKNISADVLNSNGWYTLGADITESVTGGKNQSGFDKFAFYFKRGNKIFDPMISKRAASGDNPDNYVSVDGEIFADGLYWKEETVNRDPNNLNSFTLVNENAHVHAGGLVKLGGTIYTILSVSDVKGSAGTTVTIDGQPKSSIEKAFFAYANVIDNTKQERGSGSTSTDLGYGYGYYTGGSITNDDGDLMEEWVNTVGTTSSISASVNSKNIPDGPIDIYYVVFDKAGNFVTGSVSNAYVKNNGPRLANVTVGTDYNYDGKISVGEKRAYFADNEKPGTWNKALTELTLGSESLPWLAAKGNVVVTPEIIGGNGDLSYTLEYTQKDNVSTTTEKSKISSGDNLSGDQEKRLVSDITIGESLLREAVSGKGLYTIRISDSTETTDSYKETQSADITLYMKNDVNDSEEPVGRVHRFYWKGLKDNSIYDSSSANSIADLKGHIELEKDWKNASGYDGSTVGVLDGDPKVSGKIVIKGSAFDNAGIGSLSLTIPGILNDATKVAECDFTKEDLTERWTKKESGGLDDDGYHFKIDTGSEIYNNTGHYIRWTLELDTEKYKGGTAPAEADVTLVLSVSDKNGQTTGGGESSRTVYATEKQKAAGKYYSEIRFAENDTTGNYTGADYVTADFAAITSPASTETSGVNEYTVTYVPSDYRMDIVPYITGVKTSLSDVNDTSGVTDRSALGHYPVYVYKNSAYTAGGTMTDGEAETVTIHGFNLGTAAVSKAFTSGSSSGDYSLTVNGVETLNNKNNDDSHGSYSGDAVTAAGGDKDIYDNYYNRQPNGQNNNNLTDDVYFDVWQLNDRAAVPMSGSVDDPQMKINPANGKIGFAYSNGSSAFNMPNTTFSWTYWAYDYDKVRYIALNYEPDMTNNGKVWAAAVGQDTHDNGGDPFFLDSNRWREVGGDNVKHSHSTADVKDNSICRLERINQLGGKDNSNNPSGDTRNIAQDRIQSPAIASTETGLYMAYYDALNLELRYKSGSLSNAGTGSGSHSFDSFKDEAKYTFDSFKDDAEDNKNKYSHANVQIIAQKTGSKGTEYKPGPYVSIAAVPKGAEKGQADKDTVVMVWSDTNGTMYYAYNMNPTANMGVVGATDWTVSKSVFSGKTITYCQIATDYNGGVHIAGYDSSDADVLYAYLSKYDKSPKTTAVDSYDSTGVYLTLDAALDSDKNPLPQIGYYSMASGRPKYATWNFKKGGSLGTATDIKGVDEKGAFTGLWEVTNIPTVSKVRKSNTGSKVKQNVGVGVWKTEEGVIKNSTPGDSFAVASSSGANATNYGDVYGNGTSNAVLSYMIGSDSSASIETAQKK